MKKQTALDLIAKAAVLLRQAHVHDLESTARSLAQLIITIAGGHESLSRRDIQSDLVAYSADITRAEDLAAL